MSKRRQLTPDDLAQLADALASPDHPPRIYRALDSLSQDTIGHRLFTIMRFDPNTSEVERVHSSNPAAYPVGGRKQKKDTPWSAHVLGEMKVFRTNDADGIRSAFDDHATILGLGLASVLNVPVVFQGRCVGTMNLLHEAGWYQPEHERTGLTLGAFLIPALLS